MSEAKPNKRSERKIKMKEKEIEERKNTATASILKTQEVLMSRVELSRVE